MQLLKMIAIAFSIAIIGGCAKKVTKVDEEVIPAIKVAVGAKKPVVMNPAIESIPITTAEEIHEIIYFDLDSYAIREDQAELIEEISRNASGKSVVIYGAACPIGTDKYNYLLGLKRAEAIANVITNAQRIEVDSWGEKYLISTNEQEYWKNRRAEVFIR